jgi:hypothetical protein
MTPVSRGRTVAIANSRDFISYLLAVSSSGNIARQQLRRANESGY